MMVESTTATLPRIYAWFAAVIADDTNLLAELLMHGVPIDITHPLRHSTALMEATRLGRANMVQWLLDHGAAPAFLCGLPLGTALHCALRRKQWSIARILATNMPNCAVLDAYGATPLHVLCSEIPNDEDKPLAGGIADMLIHHQCPLDTADHEGTTALHHCVINDLRDLAELLLRSGANANALIPDSKVSPLTIAALEKNLDIAELLLTHGADPYSSTHDGSTPVSICPSMNSLLMESNFSGDKAISQQSSRRMH